MSTKPVGLDQEAYDILEKCKKELKEQGINGVSFSDAVKLLSKKVDGKNKVSFSKQMIQSLVT